MIQLTHEKVRLKFNYDQASGIFTRAVDARSHKAGSVVTGTKSHGYVRIWVDGKQVAAHRLAWFWMTGEWPSMDIDHIDGCRDNNAWNNLRHVDRSMNLENMRKAKSHNRSTGLLGAYHSPTKGRFVSRIQVRGQNKNLGSFATAEEAHLAYMSAKRTLHEGCVA